MIIVNKNGTLIHNKIRYKCAIGKKGITKKKKEGDKKTPAGVFTLGKVFYRKDKIKNLKTNLSKYIIKKNMAWCDDPNNKSYNKLIFTNNKKKEKLYRKDNLYNIIPMKSAIGHLKINTDKSLDIINSYCHKNIK